MQILVRTNTAPFFHHSRLNSHLLIHLVNDHGPQNTHLVVSQDIGVQVS
jgi:hypothetical protein